MDITIQQVIASIDSNANRPFIIHFAKADGTIRQMVAIKRNRMKNTNGTAVKRSKFNYMLEHKNALLVNELTQFTTTPRQVPGLGTVHTLVNRPNINQVNAAKCTQQPRTIKIHSIREFNGKKAWA